MELYRVISRVERFPARGTEWKDVTLAWCAKRGMVDWPFHELIHGYDDLPEGSDRGEAEDTVKQSFTEGEADALLDELNEYPGTHRKEKVRLPIPWRVVPLGRGMGTSQGFVCLEADHLPFKAQGYYDLRDSTVSDDRRLAAATDYLEAAMEMFGFSTEGMRLLYAARKLEEAGYRVAKQTTYDFTELVKMTPPDANISLGSRAFADDDDMPF